MTPSLVSVVVPAYNAAGTIGENLKALLCQTYPGSVEIIVVDDGSTDGTSEAVSRFPSVRCLRQENAGPASARNRGAEAARGEIVLFTDSDCRPQVDWVGKILEGFSSDDIGAVCGSYGIANPSSFLARGIHREILYRHRVLMGEIVNCFGSYNVAIRRDLFLTLGGFDGTYRHASGEDNDLSYRLRAQGHRIRFVRGALVDHFHQEDLRRYLKEQYRHGFWRAKMYRTHPRMAGGDGYTFWKDMAEVPGTFLHLLLGPWPHLWLGWAAFFLVFEVLWGIVMGASFVDGWRYGGVMWLRAFMRSAGFGVGALRFFIGGFFIEKKR
ncbi:MAG: glycosyltransferase [Elusimicrobia bacterium]|nr:glycosyltransferase [Elusimicrobiota bacterium]